MAKTGIALPTNFTRALFRTFAKPFAVTLGEVTIGEARPRENSTGSLGWREDKKIQVKIGDTTVWVQVSVACTVIGSGELPP